MTFRDLKCKEVINCCNGVKMGFVTDLEFCPVSGQIKCLIVPEPGLLFGCFCGGKVVEIPFCDIVRIGPDILSENTDSSMSKMHIRDNPKSQYRFELEV